MGDTKPRKLETAELRDEMGGVERRMLLRISPTTRINLQPSKIYLLANVDA